MDDALVRYERSAVGDVSVTPTFSLSILNPLGAIGRALAEVICYRLETRRAQNRLQELRIQAEVASLVVRQQAATQLAELAVRQRAVDGALAVAATELVQKSKTTDALIEALRESDRQINSLMTIGNSAERHVAMQMKAELARILAEFTLSSSAGAVEAIRSVEALAGHTSADVLRSIEAVRRSF